MTRLPAGRQGSLITLIEAAGMNDADGEFTISSVLIIFWENNF
jgi:hypothetical protein